jgi:hypothetical protein
MPTTTSPLTTPRSGFVQPTFRSVICRSLFFVSNCGQDFYLDLLFYHLRLRCFVVIDLKIEEFKPDARSESSERLSAGKGFWHSLGGQST